MQNEGVVSWWFRIIVIPLHSQSKTRAFSSAGLEHLPYKQRVGGSNPSTPTSLKTRILTRMRVFFVFILFVFPLASLTVTSILDWSQIATGSFFIYVVCHISIFIFKVANCDLKRVVTYYCMQR